MAQYLINDTTLTALGDKVRERTGETAQLSLDAVINTEIDKVFDKGKQAEYDAFWTAFQSVTNGESRTNSGSYMFANSAWNDTTFKPKYSMLKLRNANSMFNTCAVTDLSAALERQGVVFDFSGCISFNSTFAYSKLTKIPPIDTTGTTAANAFSNMFGYSNALHTIEKLILKADGSQQFSVNSFVECESLVNIIVEGTIGTSLDLSYSPLSVESAANIVDRLAHYEMTDEEGVHTIQLAESCWEALNDFPLPDYATGQTWREFAQEKGWLT